MKTTVQLTNVVREIDGQLVEFIRYKLPDGSVVESAPECSSEQMIEFIKCIEPSIHEAA